MTRTTYFHLTNQQQLQERIILSMYQSPNLLSIALLWDYIFPIENSLGIKYERIVIIVDLLGWTILRVKRNLFVQIDMVARFSNKSVLAHLYNLYLF